MGCGQTVGEHLSSGSSALMEAQEIFGLDFDPEEFEQFVGDTVEEEDEEDEVMVAWVCGLGAGLIAAREEKYHTEKRPRLTRWDGNWWP